jgi:PAS domain S-box-containing protein
LWGRRRNGEEFPIEVTISQVKFSGQKLFTAIARDITEREQAEEALRYQATLLRSVTDAVITTDLDFTILSWNSAAEELYGWRAEEVIGNSMEKAVPVKYPNDTPEAALSQFRTEGTWQGEVIQKQKDGSDIYVLASVTLVRDETGQPISVLAVNRNITDLKKAVEEASYEQGLMRRLLEHAPDYIFFKDRDRRFVRASNSFSDLFDLDLKDIIGKRDEDLFPPEIAEETVSEDRLVIKTGTPLINKEEGGEAIGGEVPWVLTTKLPWYDDDEQIVGLFGISKDITALKGAEEKLRTSEARYRDLVEKTNDVIYSADLDGVITYVNPAVESLLGLPAHKVIGQEISRFVHSEDLRQLRDNIQHLFSGIVPGAAEYCVLSTSDEVRWIRVTSQPIMEKGQVTGLQGVLSDITERKMTEKRLKETAAAAERDRLARRLHDAITQTLFSASVIAEATPRVWPKDPAQAQRNMEKLTAMLRGAMAEMRAMVVELRPAAVSGKTLGDLLQTLVEANQPRIDYPITFVVEGDRILPEDVTIAIYRVAQEAFHNVVQHAEANEINIELVSELDSVKLIVHDNGRSFDQNMIPAGHFGLSIMSDRMEKIGGNLIIESVPGAGTQITASWSERGGEQE